MLTTNLDLPEAHLMLGLERQGVEISLGVSKNSPFLEVLQGSKIQKYFWEFKSRIDPRSILFLRSLLKSNSFDIVHTFSARALTSALLASLGMRARHVTYRGTTGHLSRIDPSSWLSYLNPKISRIICVSNAVREYLAGAGIDRSKLTRIYKGHNPDWYRHPNPPARESLGIPPGSFLVGCSANMRPVKGVDLLIEAFNFIPEEVDLKAILIGEIRDKKIEGLLQSPKYKGRIFVTGFRRDAPAIVSICDAFCMPSRKREGLPKALIEAMIQGIPPVVTDVGGMPELVSDRQNGLVIEEENPRAIADALTRLASDRVLAAALGAAAKERIEREFSIENTVNQTLQLYREIGP